MSDVMKLELKRQWFSPTTTIGELFIDGVRECFTLEDVVRPDGVKVYGKTAIPAGTYDLVIDWSNRFQKRMMHILAVPMFEGIRIHPGNTAVDTDGCVLVGQTRAKDFIGNSRVAYDQMFPKVAAHLAEDGNRATITITNERSEA